MIAALVILTFLASQIHAEWTIQIHKDETVDVHVLADVDSITFRDIIVAPEMVTVPAGTFIMGDGVFFCGVDEHEVTLTHDFYLGQHEVTNQEYLEAVQWAYDQDLVAVTKSAVPDNLDWSNEELLDLDDSDCGIAFENGVFSLRDDGHGFGPDRPALEVSWYGAVRYWDWLT